MIVRKYSTKFDKDKVCVLTKESSEEYSAYSSLSSPESISDMVNTLYNLCDLTEEYVYLLALNSKNLPVGVFEVSHGTVDCSAVAPREVFMRALLCGASRIILVHNHPSGDPHPSKEDILLTERIKQAGEIMGVELLDHIVVGDCDMFSFKKENYLI